MASARSVWPAVDHDPLPSVRNGSAMTPRPVATLAGREAVIYDLLLRIVAIGRHRRTWRPETVVRVAYDHLPHPHVLERELRAERRRAERAEALAARLAAALEQASRQQHAPAHAHRTVVLTPRQADVVTRACRGATVGDISRATGISPAEVGMELHRAAIAMVADHPQHCVALVSRGVVRIRTEPKETKAA